MPVRMHVLYVVVNMAVPLLSIFMEILILRFRELCSSYFHEFIFFCFAVICLQNFYKLNSLSLFFSLLRICLVSHARSGSLFRICSYSLKVITVLFLYNSFMFSQQVSSSSLASYGF